MLPGVVSHPPGHHHVADRVRVLHGGHHVDPYRRPGAGPPLARTASLQGRIYSGGHGDPDPGRDSGPQVLGGADRVELDAVLHVVLARRCVGGPQTSRLERRATRISLARERVAPARMRARFGYLPSQPGPVRRGGAERGSGSQI